MRKIEERGEVDLRRRSILGKAALAIAAAQFGALRTAAAQTGGPRSPAAANPRAAPSFASLRQIDAGVLNVGYAEAGPADGPAVLLLHGWPYDIHTYVDVAPALASCWLPGDRPVSARLRHARVFSRATPPRNGQHAALAVDILALMDALKIEQGDAGRLRLGRADGQHHRGAVAGALQGDGLGERLSHRQPGSLEWCRCRQRPSCNGGISTTSPPIAAAPATRIHARFREADLAARVAAVEIRRRDIRTQRCGASTIRITSRS